MGNHKADTDIAPEAVQVVEAQDALVVAILALVSVKVWALAAPEAPPPPEAPLEKVLAFVWAF